MKIISWNLKSAKESSDAWKLFLDVNPDIALLQDVVSIPEDVKNLYSIKFSLAVNKDGSKKKFGTAVLAKGGLNEIKLTSPIPYIQKELEFFAGNFIACNVKLNDDFSCNVISVYSPHWSLNEVWDIRGSKPTDEEISQIQLKESPEVWATEILWSALHNYDTKNSTWIVGGDFNSSETFDPEYRKANNIINGLETGGNKEIRDRMYELGFKECLLESNGKLVPTFKTTRGVIKDQIDHIYVTQDLFEKLAQCEAGEKYQIFEKNISDHLPIIADFK